VYGVLLVALVVVGFAPTLRYLGYLPRLGERQETTHWQVVSVASDRRSAQIQVDVCGARFAGVDVTRVHNDVRLAVYVRKEHGSGKPSCAVLSAMPKQIVVFDFALPRDGMIQPAASAP
jgi:hypothetical protein